MSLISARPNLSLVLQSLKPYRHQYIHIAKRNIWEFFKIGCAASRGESALQDPTVPRQMAIIWATDGAETFTLQYYPQGEDAQVVVNIPLAALEQTVSELRQAGF